MGETGLRYDALVEDALRGVVRRALAYVAEHGLPGDHHFYISFRTRHPGVVIPDHLHRRYPNEMTVVLQYQFWGLDIREDGFGVTLSFSDVPERLVIPFAAVTAFADPSVRFGLQFDAEGGGEAAIKPFAPAGSPEAAPEKPAAEQTQTSPAAERAAGAGEQDRAAVSPPAAPEETEKVVTLDRFRKK